MKTTITTTKTEKVLVVERDKISKIFKNYNECGVVFLTDDNKDENSRKLNLLFCKHDDKSKPFLFLERNLAEYSKDYIQVIPYAIVVDRNNGYVFMKKRVGENEKRLNNKYGFVGGHIEELDYNEGENVFDISKNCCLREVIEEIDFVKEKEINGLKKIGYIWNVCGEKDEISVNSVHMGIVYLVFVSIDSSSILKDNLERNNLVLINLNDFVSKDKKINIDENEIESWAKVLINNDHVKNEVRDIYNIKREAFINFEYLFDDLYGFVQLIDVMGKDEDIVIAAKASYGVGHVSLSDSTRLINYLMRNRHTSPFEMCELKFRIRIPMDCWRQMVRHRTASINERSSRYTKVLTKFYKRKNLWNVQDTVNKQSSDESKFVDEKIAEELKIREENIHKMLLEEYLYRLNVGVSREQARKDLPLCTYTEAIWKIDLHNLLHFLELRLSKNAQYEIRRYAGLISEFVKILFPITWVFFNSYKLNGKLFNEEELVILKGNLDIEKLKSDKRLDLMGETKKLEFLNKLGIE